MQKESLFLSMISVFSVLGICGFSKTEAPSLPVPLDYYDRKHNYAFAYGDWLFWKPVTSDPFTFAYRGDQYFPDQPPKGSAEYRFMTANYDFSSGYRLGGGYRSPERTIQMHQITPWQFEFAWSQIVNRASNHLSSSGIAGTHAAQFIALLFGNDSNDQQNPSNISLNSSYTSLDSVIDLKQSRLDAFFSWPIWVKENIILRLSGGSTFVWFKNEWEISGYDERSRSFAPRNWSLKWDYTGGGLFGGGDVQIPFGFGLGLYANASAALTYGHVTEKESYANITGYDRYSYFISDHYQFASFQPVVSFGAGVNFERWINQKVLVELGLGWEWHWWTNMNRFSNPWNSSYQDNLNEFMPETPYYSLFQNIATDIIYQGMVLRAGFQY